MTEQMSRSALGCRGWCYAPLVLAVAGLLSAGGNTDAALPEGKPTAEVAPRTSLANPAIHCTVPERPYVALKRSPLEVVVVNNQAVDDSVLSGHRAGYHGIGSLKHERQPRNLFVPSFSGLNFEFIHDGTTQPRDRLFEPRRVPMELRAINAHTAELYQAPTPHWGLESCLRYELLEGGILEMTFECIPRRATFQNGYLGLFWASYIDQPESKDIHFLVRDEAKSGSPGRPATQWVRASSPQHGIQATHRAVEDHREFVHDAEFPVKYLVFTFSDHRYSAPWYVGLCRGMAYAPIFRAADQVRFTQSPSGGGPDNPAWDFQWFIPNCKVGQRYQLVMRVFYTAHEGGEGNQPEPGDALRRAIEAAAQIE